MRFLAAFSLLLVCSMCVKTSMTKQNALMQQLLRRKSRVVGLPEIGPDEPDQYTEGITIKDCRK